MIAECRECKQITEVKPAREYPALAVLLDFNSASHEERDALICETCVKRKIGEFSYDPYPTLSFIKSKYTNETKRMSRGEYEALPHKLDRSVKGQLIAFYKNTDGHWVWGPIEIID